jgi:hypothetical protein
MDSRFHGNDEKIVSCITSANNPIETREISQKNQTLSDYFFVICIFRSFLTW